MIGARRFIAKIDDSNEASLGLFTNKLGFRVYEKNEVRPGDHPAFFICFIAVDMTLSFNIKCVFELHRTSR